MSLGLHAPQRAALRMGPRALLLAAQISAVLASGCARGEDRLTVFFADELVDAAARQVVVRVFRGAGDCEVLLAERFEVNASRAGLIRQEAVDYPIRKAAAVLRELPEGVVLALEVGVLDANGQLMARACEPITLGGTVGEFRVEARTLPECATRPTTLDVAILLDTSAAAARTSLTVSGEHVVAVRDVLLDPVGNLPGTTWSLDGYGLMTGEARLLELAPPTDDLGLVRDALTGVRLLATGNTRLFDAITAGAAALRARATCRSRPVLLILAAGGDQGSKALPEDARIGVFSTIGDTTDDLAVFAITFGSDAFDQLDAVLPRDAGANIRSVSSEAGLRREMTAIRTEMFGFVAR
jgi:hypothetical protein